jgi:hypothetical protein
VATEQIYDNSTITAGVVDRTYGSTGPSPVGTFLFLLQR